MNETSGSRVGWFNLLDTLHADTVTAGIWSEDAAVQAWLDVEAALAQSQADAGVIARSDADQIAGVCTLDNIDLDSLWIQARIVGYPIHPLVRMIAANLPAGPAGRVHYGATTQDIMDTGLSLQLDRTARRLLGLLTDLGDALARQTEEHAGTVMAARTHGQQAVPTTFGAKLAVFLAEVTRHTRDIDQARREAVAVSLFGAGGTNAALGEQAAQVRHALAGRLGLTPVDVPWHVSRDRLARFCLTCSAAAATCVRFAREIVDLSRSEIAEVRERDGHHRGASSTMPQKANPIICEAIIGFGITAGSTATSMLRAMEAGHERSAGEWQVEWHAVPLTLASCASAVRLTADTAATIQVFPEAMAGNLARDGGLLMSEAVMMQLTDVLGRAGAFDLAYQAAKQARAGGTDLATEFQALLTPEQRAGVGPLDIAPESYLGEAAAICVAAVTDWQQTRKELITREGV
ncbi:lyase family protein [Kribbella sp. NPDC050241]|uniref:lyase family protein n=1 Tax=Kribbella sp. NPDC050241 TaxID=3364115 RepID=UPI0037992FBE